MATCQVDELPPKDKTVQLPRDIKPCCWYQVMVSFNAHNPCHRALLYTGFLNGQNGGPGGYHMLVSQGYDGEHRINELHYLEILQELGELT